MTYESIITILIVPAFGTLAAVIVYLWKSQVKMHDRLIEQKDAHIAALEKEQNQLESKLEGLEDRLKHAETELAVLQQNLTLMQASNMALPLPAWMKDVNGKVLVV